MRYHELLNEKFSNEILQNLLVINNIVYNKNTNYNYVLILNYWKDIDKCAFWLFLNPGKNTGMGLNAMINFNSDIGYYYFETISDAISFYATFKFNFVTKLNNHNTIDFNTFIKNNGSIFEKNRMS